MLFMVIASHQAQFCPHTLSARSGGNQPYLETIGRIQDEAAREGSGVTLHSAYAGGPAHKIFLAVEASDQDNLNNFLWPLKIIGDCEIFPVTPLG